MDSGTRPQPWPFYAFANAVCNSAPLARLISPTSESAVPNSQMELMPMQPRACSAGFLMALSRSRFSYVQSGGADSTCSKAADTLCAFTAVGLRDIDGACHRRVVQALPAVPCPPTAPLSKRRQAVFPDTSIALAQRGLRDRIAWVWPYSRALGVPSIVVPAARIFTRDTRRRSSDSNRLTNAASVPRGTLPSRRSHRRGQASDRKHLRDPSACGPSVGFMVVSVGPGCTC